ncbi:hypothetical protein HZH66_006937 [Vespula vulgaris]|uniref:Transmembrane protein n=1 Tax=Vespula vulgaris TaxID=7454 RepID=A0A834K398_VESVU|nr:hypothetical protein HZH66_006937 [Vespula vulgaris]
MKRKLKVKWMKQDKVLDVHLAWQLFENVRCLGFEQQHLFRSRAVVEFELCRVCHRRRCCSSSTSSNSNSNGNATHVVLAVVVIAIAIAIAIAITAAV